MSEHLTQNQVEDYYQQKLSVAELLSVSDHLGACETCRHEVTRAVNSDAVLRAAFQVFGEVAEALPSSTVRTHLTSEQIAEYVDGVPASEEPQVIKDHLTGGDQCSLAANDLRAFRNEVAPGPKRKYHPAMVSAPVESWRHRLVASLSSLHLPSPALAFGSALTVLLLVMTGWLVWQRRLEKETKSQIVATTPSPPVSPIPVPEGTANSVIAQLNDSERRIVLDSTGKLSGADYLPPDCQRILKDALTSQRLEKSALLAGLARPGSALMSGDRQGNQFSVIEPVGKVMLSDRPMFRWSQLHGATGYVVEVYDEQFRPVATSLQLTSDSWTAQQPLARGRIYSWQVKAIKDGLEFKSPASASTASQVPHS